MPLHEGLVIGIRKKNQNWEVLKEISMDEQDCINAYQRDCIATLVDEGGTDSASSVAKGPTKYLPVFTDSMLSGNLDEFSDEVAEGIKESFSSW